MTEQQTSYRSIIKATSLFGGVQLFQIIIQIIRSKFIAILLGPSGMGIVGLLSSTINMIGGITGFGLGMTSVKSIAAAFSTDDELNIARMVKIIHRIAWLTGLSGAIIMIVFAPLLSQLAFGNESFTMAFVLLSVAVLLNQLNTANLGLLQGMRKLKSLAKASFYGSLIGLLIAIPLYYQFQTDAIVPVIMIASLTAFILTSFFTSGIKIDNVRVSKARTVAESKLILKMGLALSITGLVALAISYLIRLFIGRTGNLTDVGFYNAGFAMIDTYVGMIFTAMATDYFPRLSAVAHDNKLSKLLINQQADIAILIIAPIILFFMAFLHWIVALLYSQQFLVIVPMLYWAALGMFFKTAGWTVGYVFLAKGDSKLFLYSELIANTYIFALNLAGYYLWGITGLGLAFLTGYFLLFIQNYTLAHVKYNFSYSQTFFKIFGLQFALATACFFTMHYDNSLLKTLACTVILLLSVFLSYRELDKRINLKQFIMGFLNKPHQQ